MLQVARVLTRTRSLYFCHQPPLSSPRRCSVPVLGLQNHLCLIKEGLRQRFLFRHFSSANGCGNAPLRSLHRRHFTSVENEREFRAESSRWVILAVSCTGKRLGQILGLVVGTSYLSRSRGLTNITNCETDPEIRWSPTSEFGGPYQQSRVKKVVKRLWVPSLCVLTISLGWHYPFSLLLNLLFLMWSTKPSPSSIYLWVEQMRQHDGLNTTGLDRMRAQAAGVMHVEVRDNMLFCLARVTSLTKRSTLLGFMGDWWVIYSSSSAFHTGVKLRNFIPISPFIKDIKE